MARFVSSIAPTLMEGPRRYITFGVLAVIVILGGYLLFWGGDAEPAIDPDVRRVRRLGQKGDIPQLVAATKDPKLEAASQALTELARLQKPEARQGIEQALSDPRPEIRRSAIHALGGVADSNDVSALVQALKDPDPGIRLAACRALIQLKARGGVEPMLAVAEKGKDPQVQSTAFEGVQQLIGFQVPMSPTATSSERQAAINAMRKQLPTAKAIYDKLAGQR